MNILVIADRAPRFDKFAGDLRFFHFLTILAKKHQVFLHCIDSVESLSGDCSEDQWRYETALTENGIIIQKKALSKTLQDLVFGMVIFEFYYTVTGFIDQVRTWQPSARVVIDSVDVHYRRLFRRHDVTGGSKDHEYAVQVRFEELNAYSLADVVITVSAEDRDALKAEIGNLYVEIVPLIHSMPVIQSAAVNDDSLLFVGNFNHDPNVDAMLYFVSEVWPAVLREVPSARLKIIGDNAPEAIRLLSGTNVELLGYVKDIEPYLRSSRVAIAPVRYGAGLKGKISEAMSYGLPVVTTSVGAEGFGVEPGKHLLAADTPDTFARSVVNLLTDQSLHERIAVAGRSLIENRFSVAAMATVIDDALSRIMACKVKKLSITTRTGARLRNTFNRYVGWRLAKSV